MLDLSPLATNVAIALVAVALYALAWWTSRGRSIYEQVAIRLGLAVLMLLPILVVAGVGIFHKPPSELASRPSTGAPRGGSAGHDAEGSTPVDAARRQAEEAAKRAEAEKTQAARKMAEEDQRKQAATQSADEARRRAEAARLAAEQEKARLEAPAAAEARRKEESSAKAERPPQVTLLPPPQPPAAAPPASTPAPVPTAPPQTDTATPAPRPQIPAELKPDPVPPSEQPKWDVVPVYYGTDRNSDATPQRADYGSGRAKRLDLGRALVTVPKTHEVPKVERPWVYRLPFTQIVIYREREDPARHFTMKEVKSLSREEFLKLVRERLALSRDYKDHALVFVHGFNNTFDAALYRTAQIAYDLQFDGAPFMYSWPSKGQIGLQDYSYDRESTGQAEPYLKQFLELVTRESGAKSVSVIAHSMGNQLLLNVLRDLKRSTPDGVVLSQVILAAPDVDRDGFEFLAKEIAGVSRGMTMLAASNDRALEVSRRFWGGVPRAGDVPTEGPVVIDGMDTIDVTSLSTDVFAINHSGYAEKQSLLNDIRLLIQTGERPPEKRIPILARVVTPNGTYWRYP